MSSDHRDNSDNSHDEQASQRSGPGAGSAALTRRALIGTGVAGALAIASERLAAIPVPRARRGTLPGESSGTPTEGAAPFILEEATIAQLQDGMRAGSYTARSLAERYLARIDTLDKRGPMLRHVIELNPDALATADALDAERKTRGVRGPLHGIPVLIKDNVATADRMQTTAGSLALVGSRPPRDAFVAERLRQAGAVILGKTNLSEWANFRSTHSSSGWSARGGQGRNPYAPERTPSGSSSGSAGAVAANYCAVAVGTETDGSIVSPAAACSVVGIKPTIGLVSRAGIIPIAHSQDTAGPMARTVTDAALLLGVLSGADERDPVTLPSRGRTPGDYTRFLDANGLRGAQIGVARERFMGYSAHADRVMERALATMKRMGAVIVDPANIPNAGKYDESEFEVLLYEFKVDLNSYLAGLGRRAPVKSLRDIIAFNERNSAAEMPYFGQEIMLMAEKKGPLTSKEYVAALTKNQRLARAEGIDAVMGRYTLDAIVAPTQGPPALIDLVNGDPSSASSTSPAAVAGYPSITVPAGYAMELPVGISFFGRAWSEGPLIRLAYAFEQATRARRAPRL